ncbi:hypothetical protein FVE85_2831 [Porphyridium purpureum]|uniref:Uncharacterized protein n=1 Tax=Porphyridium purpureum TaxID=35688 RepID=A0A5J4YUH4_PORPP|nr:hypothetical protein FVE85_2831 [Porphyridium purpureum]|eukprot:POR0711..scf227_4
MSGPRRPSLRLQAARVADARTQFLTASCTSSTLLELKFKCIDLSPNLFRPSRLARFRPTLSTIYEEPDEEQRAAEEDKFIATYTRRAHGTLGGSGSDRMGIYKVTTNLEDDLCPTLCCGGGRRVSKSY